jgi:hypothetical protein
MDTTRDGEVTQKGLLADRKGMISCRTSSYTTTKLSSFSRLLHSPAGFASSILTNVFYKKHVGFFTIIKGATTVYSNEEVKRDVKLYAISVI